VPLTGQHKSMKVAAAICHSEPSEGEATEESTFAVVMLVVGSEGWPFVDVRSPRWPGHNIHQLVPFAIAL